MRTYHGAVSGLVFLLIAGSPIAGLAQNCKSSGGLAYLGNTSDGSRSVWLSGTKAGSFRLESAAGSLTVDSWSKSKRRLHVSASPEVPSGNGGTHKLYDTTDSSPCLVDTQNQKGGFTIPPNITLPMVTLPGRVLPPIGSFFPDFNPPVPPIGTIPSPGGLTPGVPGGVQPPIATLPPSGMTRAFQAVCSHRSRHCRRVLWHRVFRAAC